MENSVEDVGYESRNARDLEEARQDVNNEAPLLGGVALWQAEIEIAQAEHARKTA
jgi:hypothetical protein